MANTPLPNSRNNSVIGGGLDSFNRTPGATPGSNNKPSSKAGTSQGIFDLPLPDLDEALNDRPVLQRSKRKGESSLRQYAERVQMEHRRRQEHQNNANHHSFSMSPDLNDPTIVPFAQVHHQDDAHNLGLYSTSRSPVLLGASDSRPDGSKNSTTSNSEFDETPPGNASFFEALNTFNCTRGKFVKPPLPNDCMPSGNNWHQMSSKGKEQPLGKPPQYESRDVDNRYESLIQYLSQPSPNQSSSTWSQAQNLETFYGPGDSPLSTFVSNGTQSSKTSSFSENLEFGSKNQRNVNGSADQQTSSILQLDSGFNSSDAMGSRIDEETMGLSGLHEGNPTSLNHHQQSLGSFGTTNPDSSSSSLKKTGFEGDLNQFVESIDMNKMESNNSSPANSNYSTTVNNTGNMNNNGVSGNGSDGGMNVISKMSYATTPDHGKNLIDYIRRRLK